MRARAVVLVVALTLAACSGTIPRNKFDALPSRPPDGPHVELRYLGSGGWLFKRGDDVIATAPFVSNPTGLALLRRATPDDVLIAEIIPGMEKVEIVLVGHAHYDHTMDLPSIAATKAPNADFYGGKTVKNVLAVLFRDRQLDKDRLKAVDERDMAIGDRKGRWFFNKARTIRFMALRSTHAPHIAGIKIVATGTVDTEQTEHPGAPLSWKEGETLAFLIDFLTGDRIDFRIYYQDAASEPGTGILPVLEGPEGARPDAAILCVAAFDQVDGNPEHILANVQPRYVIGGHWEDFFGRGFKAPLRPAFGTSLEEFADRARAVSPSARIYLPEPRDTLYLPIETRR
jgi:L-ascorbate metabolism protein UlaG (beta-lactamase superfamily)